MSESKTNEYECKICKDELSYYHPWNKIEECGHLFHKHCLTKLCDFNKKQEKENKCPKCEKIFELKVNTKLSIRQDNLILPYQHYLYDVEIPKGTYQILGWDDMYLIQFCLHTYDFNKLQSFEASDILNQYIVFHSKKCSCTIYVGKATQYTKTDVNHVIQIKDSIVITRRNKVDFNLVYTCFPTKQTLKFPLDDDRFELMTFSRSF
jgi:hypothetical protein